MLYSIDSGPAQIDDGPKDKAAMHNSEHAPGTHSQHFRGGEGGISGRIRAFVHQRAGDYSQEQCHSTNTTHILAVLIA